MLQQQNNINIKDTAETQVKSRALTNQLNSLTNQLRDINIRVTNEEKAIAKIRRLRDRYREAAENLVRENK